MMTASDKVSVRLDRSKKEALEQLARRMKTTSSDLLRGLIDNLLEITALYDTLSPETVFSSNPLLTIGDFLALPDLGEEIWNQWFAEEVDSTMDEPHGRDVKPGD